MAGSSNATQDSVTVNPDGTPRTTSTLGSHLHSHLTVLRNLREGFIEQHGAEPSVSFRYSQQSTSNSTISLRVGNEVNNRNFEEENIQTSNGPSTSVGDGGSGAQPATEQMVSFLLKKNKNSTIAIIHLLML